MKTLCILRHAKTEIQQQAQMDFDRQLLKRGINDITEIAQRFLQKKIQLSKILSSPAQRAITTARIFAKEISYPETNIEQNSLIYNASLSTLLKLIQAVDDKEKSLCLIGHNPGMTLLANYLSLPPVLHIPTSGLMCIEFDVKSWSEIGALDGKQKFLLFP